MLLGFKASIFETMLEDYNDKYEYILPEITIDKNIFSDSKFGIMDLQSNFKIENYDTNNTTKFFVNDLNWDIFRKNYNSGIKAKLFGTLKNVNYDNKNVQGFKPILQVNYLGLLVIFLNLIYIKTLIITNNISLIQN